MENKTTFKEKKKICCNCKHSGVQFKINKLTHLHCEHTTAFKELIDSGEISGWDTVNEFYSTCNLFEYKNKG